MRTQRPATPRLASAILAADIHLRDSTPTCRTDDFPAALDRKLQAIRSLQEANAGCPVLVAGDVFDHWKPSPELLRWTIERIENWVAVPGQHDLPQHSLEQYDKSGLAVLEAAGRVRVLRAEAFELIDGFQVVGFPWGARPGPITKLAKRAVALVHRLVYVGEPPFPGAEKSGGTAEALLKQMGGFDLVVTGDNHETFDVSARDQRLVNPGSLARTSAKQADHEPCVFLWYAEDNSVERVVLPHDPAAVSREHLAYNEERDERLDAFIRRLDGDYEVNLSFAENLKRFFAANSIRRSVVDLIWELVEEKGTK